MSLSQNTADLNNILTTVDSLNPPKTEQEKTATPSTTAQEITPDTNKTLSKVTVAGDTNLISDNIKKDVSIFDVIGTYEGQIPILQEKSVGPTESSQMVTPDGGYDALSKVTVGAISSTYVGTSVARKTSADMTVSGATITAPAGYYASSASKSVTTATHPNPTASINSSTGVVTASHTQGTGYVTGSTTSGTLSLTTQSAKTVTPSTSSQIAVASGKYTTGAVTVAGDANLIADNIKKDVSIFGITGTYEGSGSSDLSLLSSGSGKPSSSRVLTASGVSKAPKIVQLYFSGTTSAVKNIKPCMATIILNDSLTTIGLYAQTVVASISDTITVTTDTSVFTVGYSGTTATITCNTSGWFSNSYTWNYAIWG